MSALTFDAVPHVLDDDEVPFVLGFAPDPRPFLEIDGVQYRRASDRCLIDYDLAPLRLRALLLHIDDGNVYLLANAGPLFNEWWPLLQRDLDNPLRPYLSAGAARKPVTMSINGGSVGVTVTQPSPELNMTVLVVGIGPGMTDDHLLLGTVLALPVIKAALSTLVEYRSLVGDVPDVDIQTGETTLALDDMLTSAAHAADAIAWERGH